MKRIFQLVGLLSLFLFTGCNKESDMAQVDVTLSFSGVTLVDGSLYTIEGETVSVDNVEVKSLTSQNAIIQRVVYYLDGRALLPDADNLFSTSFSTQDFRIGKHEIGMTGVILQVDKSLTDIQTSIPLIVVESENDLPENAPALGSYSITMSTQH